jgi:hypothetical protein
MLGGGVVIRNGLLESTHGQQGEVPLPRFRQEVGKVLVSKSPCVF